MAIFFFTVGLEVRREFAIGELTSWSRAIVPVVAAVAGLAVPAALFVLIAAGSGHEHAWGVVISTDTAFLVGALALIGPRVPGRLRVFLLALAVVDDIGALSIIALVYTENFTPLPLLVAAVGLVGVYFTRYLRGGRGPVYATLSVIVWLAFLASGVHPTLAGVAIALLVPVYRPNRTDVEHALDLARTFRQSPNTEYARAAANSLRESISINERLQSAYAPYVAYVILPLFALANAGVELGPEILAGAVTSPLTWGIVVGLVARQARRRLRLHAPSCASSDSESSVLGSRSTASSAAQRSAASDSRSRCSSSTSRSTTRSRRTRRESACSRHPSSPSSSRR